MRKAQVSFELLMIFTLILIALAGFMYLITERMSEISEEQDFMLMRGLANNIKNEVVLASSVNDNYMRKFEMPRKINGKEYNISIAEDSLFIELIENGKVKADYFTVFPVPVKGKFIDKITENTTEHCISKSSYDGIRIARNLASIEANSTEISVNEEIDVMLRLNCVTNLRSAGFTITFDNDKLEFMSADFVSDRAENPLFDEVFLFYEPEQEKLSKNGLPLVTENRLTYQVYSRECATGSGNVVKLRFKAISEGDAEISFDEAIGTENIVLLDCTASSETISGLIDSKQNAVIAIN